MTKQAKKIFGIFLCLLLFFGLLPSLAFASADDVFWPIDGWLWAYSEEGALVSASFGQIPEEYGDEYYNEAYAMDVTLSGIEENANVVVGVMSSEFYDIESLYGTISTIGYTYETWETPGLAEEILADAAAHYSEDDEAFKFDVQFSDGYAQLIVYVYFIEEADEYETPLPIILNFYTVGSDTPTQLLTKVTPECGQFEAEHWLYGDERATYLVVPNGMDTVKATLTFSGNDYVVSANGVAQGPISENNQLEVTLNAAQVAFNAISEDSVNTITVSKDNYVTTYTIYVINQRFDDLPDAVVEYLCIGSQYTNTNSSDTNYGLRPVRSLVGSNYSAGGAGSGPVSLGNFGGFITYYYADAITDDPRNPYGIDFITFGNAYRGGQEFGEPGQVYVSEDGATWYALAGGMHYEDYADWEYTLTYVNDEGLTEIIDKTGNQKKYNLNYPTAYYYPYYDFGDDGENSLTFTGICFQSGDETDSSGSTMARYAGFGYTDLGSSGTQLEGETLSWASWELLARNIAKNPYAAYITGYNVGHHYDTPTDGMDLAWAVDEEGQPVDVSGKEFHYVKIATATNIVNQSLGEKSTEVNMVRIAQANESAVGKTAAPAGITVDGQAVDLTAETLSAVVDGPFNVAVDAPAEANVYINNQRASTAHFDQMPLHKIVRVIVQEGEKEPAIYVINLTEGDNPSPVATLTLDANGGTVEGGETWSCRFDADMSGDPLPQPTAPGDNYEFTGWYSGQKLYTGYPDVVADITLEAHWLQTGPDPEAKEISVSFRLIGSTLAEKDIDLNDGDYHGAEYVTWIPTKTYTMHEGDTVADLIILACNEAGISQSNAAKGYVATVTAPKSLGGYELSEFTNGERSGWLYTINGDHPDRGVTERRLADGDAVILHYADDYAWEVKDWGAIGGSGYGQQSDDEHNYWDAWLDCEDVAPPADEPPVVDPDWPDWPNWPIGPVGPVEPEHHFKPTPRPSETQPDKPADTEPTPAGPGTPAFRDVPNDAWYANAVAWAVANGVTSGTGADTFSPNGACTRGQIVTFLWRAAGSPKADSASAFRDVAADAWYAQAVAWAVEQGITVGVSDGLFAPDAPCTRGQIVTFLWRAAGEPKVNAANPFADVAEGSFYYDAVLWAVEQGITTGTSATTFSPDQNCTRAQVVTFLWRAAR
ncbi:MAG: S-layer homology domain-containing protein [Firmicutes bacterium]|nr:S-layer homology domain-containing protein [Bacillota bacterium]